MVAAPSVPYCGLPPVPIGIWSRWNPGPFLILVLVIIASAYAFGTAKVRRRGHETPLWRQVSFYTGWTVATLALISPLCPLSVSLFAARVSQHMILALVAAPLLAAGNSFGVIADLWRRNEAKAAFVGSSSAAPICAAALFALLLWFWHAPAPYAATFRSTAVYWSMHITVFGAALWLWTSLINAPPSKLPHVVFSGLLSSIQMGFLGALITFAARPLYAPHLLTTAPWGFTPLQDQQLGGAIMWIPGCAIFLLISTLILWRDISRAEPAGARAQAVSR